MELLSLQNNEMNQLKQQQMEHQQLEYQQEITIKKIMKKFKT